VLNTFALLQSHDFSFRKICPCNLFRVDDAINRFDVNADIPDLRKRTCDKASCMSNVEFVLGLAWRKKRFSSTIIQEDPRRWQ